jgi:hypothetical protein
MALGLCQHGQDSDLRVQSAERWQLQVLQAAYEGEPAGEAEVRGEFLRRHEPGAGGSAQLNE